MSARARGDGQSGPIIGRLTVSGDPSDAETRAALPDRMMAIWGEPIILAGGATNMMAGGEESKAA